MPSKILEKILEPSRILVNSDFLLKIRVERIQSCNLITEDINNIITEDGKQLITEGDFYE